MQVVGLISFYLSFKLYVFVRPPYYYTLEQKRKEKKRIKTKVY